ncbi:MAG: branched-chain amino acid ABC transporter permease [Planktomarina sp.]|jgi:branched-chain amino acid transport system permease protein|nr:branched-chain amino acid ABC transporter permease [Planktomarina sp.]MDT2058090.1 branched-chain amino acid ABC transporter permease [Planktomarina sp.]MDT2072109.1 branched-chain amino acid ABC transporter permease [Planktomarina sp.]MDT2077563.1 branched-chain amino acid ABC transporter permease [Planktomarina sp.]HAJ84304.1 branched-chain amino acid ABC transporter permease [Paracoccaceae bacterium]|tara:strand:+ start:2956 stop:3957 length:1002 start_codon:yes stop_codon:yes gene_type:complete
MFPDQFLFGVEVMLNGLMAGVLYALVALGFVLIFKASGIFNYAQGVMALFGALTLVGIMDGQVPFAHLINSVFGTDVHHFGWHVPAFLSILLVMVVMVGLAWCVQHFIFRHLVGQEPIILFMATIGLAYFMEGFGDMMWNSEIKKLDIGIPQGGSMWIEEATSFLGGTNFYGFFIDKLEIVASLVAIVLVIVLVAFAQYTKQGRAMRAVADDHQAALSVGISLSFIWVLVWSLAGFVALVAGIMWGAKSGVQFSLSLIALKALPVLMLGGFTSIPGAIVGGLIVGVGEKLFEFLIGAPFLGGATENWFAYMLALVFLVFRPQGLFGEKIIERV